MVCQPLDMTLWPGQLGYLLRRASRAGSISSIVWLAAGCTCGSKDGAKAIASAPLEWACRSEPGGKLGSVSASGSQPVSDDGPVLFAVELGRATRTPSGGLALPYLDHDGQEQRARAWLESGAGPPGTPSSRTLDLGVVRGDAAPPQVAAAADRVYFAVRDSAAAGENYRIGLLESGGVEPRFSSEIVGGLDRSPSFDLAARSDGVVLVWDDWDSSEARGAIRSVHLGVSLDVSEAKRVSPLSVDVEAPRVVATETGYAVAWMALGQAVRTGAGGGTEDEPLVRVTERWVQVLRLDPSGSPLGGPIDVTAPGGFVVGFDVVTGHGDHLMFALREDQSAPGVSGGSIRTAAVSPGGSVSERLVTDVEVGGGIPSLVFDPDPKDGAPHGWLAYAKRDGDTRLVALAPDGSPIEIGERLDLGEDILLDAIGGRVTVGRPLGRNLELERLTCGPRERPAGPALPPQEITE